MAFTASKDSLSTVVASAGQVLPFMSFAISAEAELREAMARRAFSTHGEAVRDSGREPDGVEVPPSTWLMRTTVSAPTIRIPKAMYHLFRNVACVDASEVVVDGFVGESSAI